RERSARWFEPKNLEGFLHRAAFKGAGFRQEAFQGKPLIGICNSWSELNHCNIHLRDIAEAVKRGVWQAGGFPAEFPTISLDEFMIAPTTMLYRNLMAMDVEEMIRAHPLDGVVLLGGCDKTVPAQLMGAASADIPSIFVTGGPQLKGNWRGQELGSCTDCRRLYVELRAGRITEEEYAEVEGAVIRSSGHCMVMGTASTMACIVEAMGMTLPGGAAIPAPDSRRLQLAEEAGHQIVRLVKEGVRPSHIMTERAFENAIRVLMALGGSANAVIHLVAVAGRLGIDLPLKWFDELSRSTPLLANMKPSGEYLMEDFYYAGGLPAMMRQMGGILHLDAPTVNGCTLGENIADARTYNEKVIFSGEKPRSPEGGLAILYGSLAPDGAVIKHSAASLRLLQHRGRAIVFEDYDELERRIDSPDLDVTEEDVLVLKNTGPVGAPGMPEWGFLPIPKKLLEKGVRDMVRISDARMSGTAYGTIVLHVAPESAIGGPLALVQSGDMIELDVPNRRLELLVSPEELVRRRAAWKAPKLHYTRGYGWLFQQHILQAHEGCDFDFLRADGLHPQRKGS
ncbi:MAG: IlvD/Edd family dehydratase, partial [Chloroflexota bacterium]|nr:IlvD/Edd family dehydratase [Chloroflexota bacterium]